MNSLESNGFHKCSKRGHPELSTTKKVQGYKTPFYPKLIRMSNLDRHLSRWLRSSPGSRDEHWAAASDSGPEERGLAGVGVPAAVPVVRSGSRTRWLEDASAGFLS